MWVPFNEGWGQFDSPRISSWIKELDPSRLVNHASGWTDRGVSDVKDIHSYPDPKATEPEPSRAAVLGEFGGLGFNVPEHTWESEGWGYDLLPDFDELVRRYESLYIKLLPMIESPGLSAAVYTQISDIETENNGLMTYDRKVTKIKPAYMRMAHEGYLPPQTTGQTSIFLKETAVELKCMREGARILYTVDGTEPGVGAMAYESPITLTETTTLKAKAFWETGDSSRTSTFVFTRTEPHSSVALEGSPGLMVQSFRGEWSNLPDFSRLSPDSTSTAETIGLEPAPAESGFALHFSGYIRIPETGIYIFTCASDDGSRLFIGDQLVLDNDGVHGIREKSGAIALEAGFHPLNIQYFQGRGGRGLNVFMKGPDMTGAEIPADMLFH